MLQRARPWHTPTSSGTGRGGGGAGGEGAGGCEGPRGAQCCWHVPCGGTPLPRGRTLVPSTCACECVTSPGKRDFAGVIQEGSHERNREVGNGENPRPLPPLPSSSSSPKGYPLRSLRGDRIFVQVSQHPAPELRVQRSGVEPRFGKGLHVQHWTLPAHYPPVRLDRPRGDP